VKSIVAENGKYNEPRDYIVYATSLPFSEANNRNEAINSVAVIKEPGEKPKTNTKN
jgi:hypothetical protein